MQKLTCRLLLIVVATIFLSCMVSAQGSCPTAGDQRIGWAANSTVTFNVSLLPTYMQAQVRAAFQAWNNDTWLKSGVEFQEVTGSTSANFTLDTVPDSGQTAPAQSDIVKNSQNNMTLSASTHIKLDAKASDGSNAFNTDPNSAGFSTIWQKVATHEIAHTMGLDDVTTGQVQGTTVENQIHGVNDTGWPSCSCGPGQCCPGGWISLGPHNKSGGCDNNAVNSIPQYKNNTSVPPPTCNARSCPGGYVWDPGLCNCTPSQHNPSPIIIDVDGSGYQLTSASDGVTFDILADGSPIKISWTAAGSTNAFLVLDRNRDGAINSGAELFGDHTPQPPSDDPNGFLALAVYDLPENGGNGDGKIDRNDLVWSRLRLWQDTNHDGISQPSELHSLDELGVESISLHYSEQHHTDEWGNYFRYRASVESKGSKWAWDVFLVSYPERRLDAINSAIGILNGCDRSPGDRHPRGLEAAQGSDESSLMFYLLTNQKPNK